MDNASYPTKEIAENSHIFRTLGLGYANLGSLIMSYGLAYDSDEGRALAGAITAIMTGHAYEQSARNRRRHGAVPGYHDARCAHVTKPVAQDNVDSMLDVIHQHREAVEDIQPSAEFHYLKEEARQRLGPRPGARAANTATATPRSPCSPPPAPSRFLMDCDTTGIEPDIALVKYKLLAGGGMLKIVNRTVPEGLRRLGYSAAGDRRHHRPHREIRHHRGRRKRTASSSAAASSRSICRSSIAPSSRTAASAASTTSRTSR